jgi:hypothetical protein
VNIVLGLAFVMIAALHWWVAKAYLSQPRQNHPMIFWNPVRAAGLVIAPQVGFVLLVVLGFMFTNIGWWLLGVSVVTFIVLASRAKNKPQGNRTYYSGGNGSSEPEAIVISLASSKNGIAAEYAYIEAKYGHENVGWTFERKYLVENNEKYFDVFYLKLSSGEQQIIYFDITSFFGRP